jgi:tetratricopeptide (TPR) repeat protein
VGHNSTLRALLLVAACGAARAQTAPADPFRLGSDAYRSGNCPDAVRLLSQSQTPRALLMMGRCYLEMGEYAKAQTALKQYTTTVPGDETAAILLARAAEGAGRTAQAVTMLDELSKQAPTSVAVQDALAEAYVKSEKRGLATPLYKQVLSVQPRDIGAMSGLAEIALSESQWDTATEQYKKVLELSPENAAANAGVGRAQVQLKHPEAAIPYLLHATRLLPGDWVLVKALATCYIKTSQWSEAIQSLEYDSSVTHADDEEATGWMVQAFGHTGDTARAERYYRAVLQNAAGNFTARITLADLLYDAKRWKEAKEQYVVVLKSQPERADINDRVGQIAERENALVEAIQYYALACKSPNATAPMKERLARAYFANGDMTNARPSLEAVIGADPDNREVKTMLMKVAINTNRMDDAVHYANELLPGDPNNVDLLRLLARDAEKNHNFTPAADFLERALAVNGKDREVRVELVGIYTDSDSPDKLARAFDLMNEYVGLYPKDYEGFLLLANLYRRKKDAAQAREYFRQGFDMMPANPPARLSWAYTSFTLLLLSENKYEEALANQRKAAELDPNDANAVYHLGLAYLKLKRKDDVNATRDKLSQLTSPEVPELLADLDKQIEHSRINK